jgi:hypothetical protein
MAIQGVNLPLKSNCTRAVWAMGSTTWGRARGSAEGGDQRANAMISPTELDFIELGKLPVASPNDPSPRGGSTALHLGE